MSRFLHRFYDLFSGGAEAVILSFIRAFPEHQHLLIFNRISHSALSNELISLRNVKSIQIKKRAFAEFLVEYHPDVVFFHWYPPMTAEDFAGIPREYLTRSILYNHWFTELPYVEDLREYWFLSPTSKQETANIIPNEKCRILLNPVRAEFFTVCRRPEAAISVGRHSRPIRIKFSDDFFDLHEGIAVADLQVRVLGCGPGLAESTQKLSPRLKHTYWMLPFNSMPATKFLSFLSIYVYKTYDLFRETCPLSILEALASGLPVVAENKGGIRDLIVPGETGMLCDSLQDYQKAVQSLLTNAEQLRQFSEQARQWALQHVSPEAYRNHCHRLLKNAFPGLC